MNTFSYSPCWPSQPRSAGRLSEPGPADTLVPFFTAVAKQAMALSRRWGLHLLDPVWTDHISEDEALRVLVRNLGIHAS